MNKSAKMFRAVVLLALSFSLFSSCVHASTKNEDEKYLEMINRMFYTIKQNYVDEVDTQKLYEGAIRGMLDSLDDPYTSYLDAEDWRSLTDTTVGNFGGVGLTISKPKESTADRPAYVEVVSPVDGAPGDKAGIQAGDLIVEINGIDTENITMNDVLGMLRGTVGESVDVKIRRRTVEFERTLVRELIEVPSVKSAMIGKTGYIRISEFAANTATRVQEAIDDFTVNGYNSLIIDLRNNGGGLLTSAVDIADMFIDSGLIVSTKSRLFYENSVYRASKAKTRVRGIPIIVLINGGSASASEILSGALKDNHVAYLVGERTYGKGSVQIPHELMNNDGFKITVARYYTPSDTNIDKTGIPPDREVLFDILSDEQMDTYISLLNSDIIRNYVEKHPSMTESDIASYAKRLSADYPLDLSLLRKLVRNEVDRTKPARVYDLDYDVQLNAALKILASEDVLSMSASAPTVKEVLDAQSQEETKE